MKTLTFHKAEYDNEKQKVFLYYNLESDKDFKERFVDVLDFSAFKNQRSVETNINLLQSLLLVYGIRYWAAFQPQIVKVAYGSFGEDKSNFWNSLYRNGLSEFFYTNQIDPKQPGYFSPNEAVETDFPQEKLVNNQTKKALVSYGGGKDSLLVCHQLQSRNIDFDVFAVNPASIQIRSAESIDKHLVPVLYKVNQKFESYIRQHSLPQGHIPFTAQYMFTGLTAAYIGNYQSLIFANEKSADEPNIHNRDLDINHQWSKGSEFENLFVHYAKTYITKNVEYTSLLRDWDESAIISSFVEAGLHQLPFSSCNVNFIKGKHISGDWCGECAKCAYVYLWLATQLSEDELSKVFKKNLFNQKNLLPTYKALCGIEANKPFECVGLTKESKEAFMYVLNQEKHKGFVLDQMAQILINDEND